MNEDFLTYQFEDFIGDESFQRWTKSTANPAEASLWNEFYESYPEKRELVDQAKAAILELSRTESEVDPHVVHQSWNKLEERIQEPAQPSGTLAKWLVIAAVFVVILFGTYIANFILNKNETSTPNYITYESGFGEKREIAFADGSGAVLNANSSIRLSGDWKNSGEREVWVEKGEVFFKVAKKENRKPFVVHADELQITVLGTQFNVNTRGDKMEVLLTEGKVALKKNHLSAEMSPGDRATISDEEINIQQVDINSSVGWLRNSLVLDNTPLSEVAGILEEHYGISVELDDQLANRKLSGELPNENLELIVEALSLTLDLEITRDRNKLIIRPNAP